MTESVNDRFERLAEEFYKETRMMAPGKSVPDAFGPQDEEKRWEMWCAFVAKQARGGAV